MNKTAKCNWLYENNIYFQQRPVKQTGTSKYYVSTQLIILGSCHVITILQYSSAFVWQ